MRREEKIQHYIDKFITGGDKRPNDTLCGMSDLV